MICLQKYDSPDEYISDVQGHIRWKRARCIVEKELSDHITDRRDALLDGGLDERTAMEQAIREMGDAELVGEQFNRVHRPGTHWPLLVFIATLAAAGMILTAALAPALITPSKIIGLIAGACIAVILYFTDYTVLVRFPRLIYLALTALTFILLLWDLRNGYLSPGQTCASYALLCFPIAEAGILFHIKDCSEPTGALAYALYACVPMVFALLDRAFGAFIMLFICGAFIFGYGLKRNRLKWSISGAVGIACALAALAAVFLFLSQIPGFVEPLTANTAEFCQLDFASVFRNAAFIGKSSLETDAYAMRYLYDHPVTLLVHNYGYISVLVLFSAFSAFFYMLRKASKKQSAPFGKLLTDIISVLFALQILLAVLADIGILPNCFTALPFAVTGGAFMLYDLLLAGVVLAVVRNESIAKEWIKLKHNGRKTNV